MSLFDTLGAALRTLRVARGLSQRELAGRCELSRSRIGELEHDRRRPDLGELEELLGALDCDLGDLHRALGATDLGATVATLEERLERLERLLSEPSEPHTNETVAGEILDGGEPLDDLLHRLREEVLFRDE